MSWNYDAKRSLNARGDLCKHCKQVQMRAVIFAELRDLVRNGQLSDSQMEEACQGYCLGHVNEWIPDFIIREER